MLEVGGLETRYGSVVALKGISLDVAAGEIVGVLGPNGAGKTTTLSTIIGLLKPAAGRIRFLDRDIAGLPPDRVVAAGVGGAALAAALAWIVQRYVLEVPIALAPHVLVSGVALATTIALAVGFLATYRLLGHPPLAVLRQE